MKISERQIAMIGWIATVLTVASFTFPEFWLRIINSIACVVWIAYGFLRRDKPMMVTNFFIAGVHMVKIFMCS